jgi:hypothetical protein
MIGAGLLGMMVLRMSKERLTRIAARMTVAGLAAFSLKLLPYWNWYGFRRGSRAWRRWTWWGSSSWADSCWG